MGLTWTEEKSFKYFVDWSFYWIFKVIFVDYGIWLMHPLLFDKKNKEKRKINHDSISLEGEVIWSSEYNVNVTAWLVWFSPLLIIYLLRRCRSLIQTLTSKEITDESILLEDEFLLLPPLLTKSKLSRRNYS